MTDFDPFAQTGGPIEGMGGTPRPERRRRRRPPPTLEGDLVDAGFGRRLFAVMVDMAILGVVMTVTGWVEAALPKEPGRCGPPNALRPCEVLTTWGAAIFGLWVFVLLVSLAFVWPGYFEGLRGASPGKRIAGLRIVDAGTGATIGVPRAVLRSWARILSAMPFFLGYLWMLWDRDGRTWHDRLTRSRVVKA